MTHDLVIWHEHGELGWHVDAACSEHPELLEKFFSDSQPAVAAAMAMCAACSVRDDCLDYAIDHHIDHGIWGGATSRERRKISAQRAPGGLEGRADRRVDAQRHAEPIALGGDVA